MVSFLKKAAHAGKISSLAASRWKCQSGKLGCLSIQNGVSSLGRCLCSLAVSPWFRGQPDATEGLVERASPTPIDCGTFVMDCSTSPGACTNACYWHKCIHGDTYTYYDDGEQNVGQDTAISKKHGNGNRLTSLAWQMDHLDWGIQPSYDKPMNQRQPPKANTAKPA